ncbi:MAG: histidine triad nucleotide-binding protein [Gemmatimonadota bacterium]|nr:histidine triad nucleotide-binding protein [Gemmatimonadota bacterium]
MANSCLFCRIARHEIPSTVVAEDERLMAFRDVHPQAPTHILIIPKAHVDSLNDVGEFDLVGRMTRMAVAIAEQEGIARRGYRTVINTNADGGQTVFHLHLHLLGGRSLGWPPG